MSKNAVRDAFWAGYKIAMYHVAVLAEDHDELDISEAWEDYKSEFGE